MNEDEQSQQARALLPWYVNGTLHDEEQQLVETWLASSAEARAELAVLEKLQQAVQREEAVEAPVEFGWQRLQKQMETPQPAASKVKRWQKLAGMAAGVVIAIQAGLLFNLQQPATDVELLSGEGQASYTVEGQLTVQVMFDQRASWKAITALLEQFDADIVAGPSALGLVVIELPATADSAKVIDRLRQSTLVHHVQTTKAD